MSPQHISEGVCKNQSAIGTLSSVGTLSLAIPCPDKTCSMLSFHGLPSLETRACTSPTGKPTRYSHIQHMSIRSHAYNQSLDKRVTNRERPKIKSSGETTAPLTQLSGRKESRTREAVKLHTLNVNIAIWHRAPELEQNESPGSDQG